MKRIFTLLISLYFCINLFAQNNDAATAKVVCNDPPLTATPMGSGIDDFADPDNHIGCNGPEISSMWLYFKMDDATPPNTQLGFIINPTAGAPTDYDWAIYGPDVNCGALGDPIRCSSSSGFCGFCPQTGLGMGATDVSEGPGTGDGFLMLLTVQAGEGYYLFLENFSNNGSGFTLNFTDGADYVDCGASTPCCINLTTSDDVTVCAGADPFQITATASSNNPVDFEWVGTGDGTSYLSDPTSDNPYVTIPPDFTGTITYTVTASDGGCEVSESLMVKVNPQPQVMINPVGIICTNGGNVQMTGTPINGSWGGIATITGIINPSNLSPGNYDVTYSYTNQFGCKGSAETEVEIAEPENIIIDEIDPLCVYAAPVLLMASPTGGTWSGNIQGIEYFDPAANGPGFYYVVYTYISPEGCKSKDSILIEVVDLPEINLSDPGPLCADELSHIIDVDPSGGVWSGVADLTGTVYPKNLGPGTFKVKYSYTDEFGCVNKDSIDIEIEAAPNAVLDLLTEVCNSINSGKPTTVDFNTLIVSGNKSGVWKDLNNSGATGSFPVLNFNNISPGTYNFSYTIKSTSGACPDFVETVQIKVVDCNCPNVSLGGPVDLCNSNNSIDLNNYKITTEIGTWSITTVPSGSNPASLSGNILNISGKDPGIYIATFTLSTVPPVNCPASNTITINLYSKPESIITTPVNLCNKPLSNFPNIIDLYSLIISGDKSGTWIDNNSSGAVGSFNSLDFTGITAGTYNFTYTTASAILPCTENTYSIEIIVDDCDCPSLVIDNPTDLCSASGSLDLSTLSSNSDPGTWTLKSNPAGSNPAILTGNIFSTNNSDPGLYIFTYTLNSTPPTGCPAFKDINVNVIPEPFTQLKTSAKVCNSAIINPDSTILDFSTLIINGDNTGNWIDKNNSGASGSFPVLDFNGVLPGNYTFEYTTGNAIQPCQNISYSISIIVIDCNCPDLSILPKMDLCNSQNTFDLNSLKLTSESGNWSIISTPGGTNPSTITGNIFNTYLKDPGNYLIQFTASITPPVGCPAFSQASILLNSPPNPGTVLSTLDICEGTQSDIILSDRITGEDLNGTWTLNPGSSNVPPNAFDQLNGTLNTNNLSPGNYTFDYSISAVAPCADVKTSVSIVINPKYVFDAGNDETFDCSTSSVTLGQNINIPTGYQLIWSGPGITVPSDPTPDVKKAGKYIATITTDKNCISNDSLLVTILGNPISEVKATIKNVSCPEVQNGEIEISNIIGGTPSYTYLWNGAVNTNTPLFDKLAEGTYTLHIEDQLGCIYDTVFTIQSGKGFTLDLGPDLILDQGQDYSISAIVNIAPNLVDSIIWFPSVCSNCIQINEKADADITYQVYAVDINGCKASDVVNITVTPVRKVFIPNVFSPNGDGINDVFFIRSDVGVKEVESFAIYNRWGSLMFSQEHFQPNDPDYGWSGKVNDEYVNNNVFVYWARIRFSDGEVFTYKGDITIDK